MNWRHLIVLAMVMVAPLPRLAAQQDSGLGSGSSSPTADAERGRLALISKSFLLASWRESAYREVGKLWESAPDPSAEPDAYARAFLERYGLNPAPYPNHGYPMGLRQARTRRDQPGLMIDCMVCHGGSIGGQSYVGLGNTTLDITPLLEDLTRADGRRPPLRTFILNSTRGTVNAGMISAVLISLRNPDLSFRPFPLPLAAKLPEIDVPPWWNLGRKSTMYQDGRTSASSVRANMQFMLAELSREQFESLEPTFRDIQAYFKSLKPPKYPFPIEQSLAARGQKVFEANCVKCHGTYGPEGQYPNVIVELDRIGTDRARAEGLSDGLVAHYNASWFGQESQVAPMVGYQAPPLDGVWATAPYLHNGSVPTVHALLKSSERPKVFLRPPSTEFEHYDRARLGWKAVELNEERPATSEERERKRVFDTTQWGLGNAGHTFGDRLSDEERRAVIEYLKTL